MVVWGSDRKYTIWSKKSVLCFKTNCRKSRN